MDGVNGNGRGWYLLLVILGIELGLLNFIKKSFCEEMDVLFNYEFIDNRWYGRCLVYFLLNLILIRVYLEFFEGDSELEDSLKGLDCNCLKFVNDKVI